MTGRGLYISFGTSEQGKINYGKYYVSRYTMCICLNKSK